MARALSQLDSIKLLLTKPSSSLPVGSSRGHASFSRSPTRGRASSATKGQGRHGYASSHHGTSFFSHDISYSDRSSREPIW